MLPLQTGLLSLALTSAILAAQTRFIQPTPENTLLTCGTPLADAGQETPWKWLPDQGNGGILESRAHENMGNAPPLRLTINDCTPQADYEVFGYFWAPGFGDDQKEKEVKHWPARFGLGLATLTTYGGRHVARVPWIISPGSEVGRFAGLSSILEEANPLPGLDLISADGDTRLIRASIGIARADAKGTLMVYLDDFPESAYCEKTRIDGIAIQPAPKNTEPSAGAGDPHVLHLAIRANDWPSAQRELDAGADVNALDDRGRSVLFHPASCGDLETLEKLLTAGANPNRPGQSLLPLTGAASTDSIDSVRMLLAAGAEVPATRIVPTEPPPHAWTIGRSQDSRIDDYALLHPAIAAIRTGSLATLNVLLEKDPELDLEKLSRADREGESARRVDALSRFLVEDAMRQGHDDLAAFLIERGCTLAASELLWGNRSPESRPHALLAYAICADPPLEKTLAALLRRGVPPIHKLGPPHYSKMDRNHGIPPWDGLSAAVAVANVPLTQRFLLEAKDLPLYYEEFLLAMALWHGEPRVLSMIRQAFPDAGKHSYRAPSRQARQQDSQSLRLLLPRVTPSATRERAEGDATLTLAVLATPNAGGEAAILEAVASTRKAWIVVDRAHIEAALHESQIANPWADGEYRFAELGDRMAADVLLFVTRLDSEQIKLLRFEAVDVATGLAVWREHIDAKEFDPEKAVPDILERVQAVIRSARTGKLPTAITLLPFSIDSTLWSGQSMLGPFRAAVQAEIDSTPGLLTVGMDAINAVGGEQALGGDGTFWAAAYTLEAGVSAHEDGQVSVTLRLRSLGEPGAEPIDFTKHGPHNEIPTLASRAFQAMATPEFFQDKANAPDAGQRAAEATRLLREAQMLITARLYADALPLLDRANALGATPRALVSAHYQALVRQVRFFRFVTPNHDVLVTPHPITLRHQAILLSSLDSAQKMLDQMTYYLGRFGPEATSWREQRFHQAVVSLSYMRACIPNVLPGDAPHEAIQQFTQSLDRFTADYFNHYIKSKPPNFRMRGTGAFNNIFYQEEISASMLHRNPELLAGRISLFFGISKTRSSSASSRSLFEYLLAEGDSLMYGKKQLLVDEINKRIKELPVQEHALRKAELAYLSSHGEAQPQAARTLLDMLSTQSRAQWHSTRQWVGPNTILKRFGLSLHGSDSFNPWVIPAIAHESHGVEDWLSQAGYAHAINELINLESMEPNRAKSRLEMFGSWNGWTRFAEAASSSENPRQAMDVVYRRAGDWELTYGRTLREELETHAEALYFPNKTKSGEPIHLEILCDFRKLDSNNPGMLYMPTADNKDENRLWLYYQPYEPKPEKDGNHYRIIRRYPKIVAFDCTTGEIKVTADVGDAPGIANSQSGHYSLGIHYHQNSFLAQTDDLILTSIPWPRSNSQLRYWGGVGMLIRKDTGDFIPLNPQVSIKELFCLISGSTAFGAIPIGDQFISAILPERSSIKTGVVVNIPHEIIKIGPDGTVTGLTQYGRRPALTPFDPVDRFPRMLVPDGDRLLVLHNMHHAARYDPTQNTWEPCKEAPNQLDQYVRNIINKYFNEQMACNRIPKSDTMPEITILWNEKRPDALFISQDGGEPRSVPVSLEIPHDFGDQIIYSDKTRKVLDNRRHGPFTTFQDNADNEMINIVVLHRTPTHLILGKQVKDSFNETRTGKRIGEYLPVLWSLPIQDLQNALMHQQ
jgi:hypothetical protein